MGIAQRDKQGRFIKGNGVAISHGAYTKKRKISVRGVRALNRYLDQVKVELEKATPDLNVKKGLLIDQVIRCHEKVCLIDMWIRKIGILRPDKARRKVLELHPVLAHSYISFLNTQRLALLSLGIDGDNADKILTPIELAKKVDEEKRQ